MNVLKENNFNLKLKNLFRNFMLMILSYFIFFFLLGIINLFVLELDFDQYQQIEILEIFNESPWKFAFLAIIAAPIIEESIFRSLLKPSKSSLRIFICSILYMLGIVIIPEEAHWSLRYLLLFGTISFIYYALGNLISDGLYRKICFYFYRYYIAIWIGGAILFGFVHIFNYLDSFELNLVLFLMIFPRIIAGFFFGKVKLENKNLIWPILLHSMNNSMVLILLLPFNLS
ncbi:CPBP family intramembrane metalloprotease [Gramella sp. BOM4]|nr:CPBP family intramembrane metalloprotease [Christiangramia bathymodioli]